MYNMTDRLWMTKLRRINRSQPLKNLQNNQHNFLANKSFKVPMLRRIRYLRVKYQQIYLFYFDLSNVFI